MDCLLILNVWSNTTKVSFTDDMNNGMPVMEKRLSNLYLKVHTFRYLGYKTKYQFITRCMF